MTDMGGTHGWLLDAGGGAKRAMRSSLPVIRPTDEQLGIAIGLPILTRHLITDAVERVTWIGSTGVVQSAILKIGGFLRDPRERLLYRELLGPADGAPALIRTIDTTLPESDTARNDPADMPLIETSDQEPTVDWLLMEDVAGHAADLGDPIDVTAIYRQLAMIHNQHRAPLQRYQRINAPTIGHDRDTGQTNISVDLHALLVIQSLTLRSVAEGHERLEHLAMLVDRAISDRDIWEFSMGARENIVKLTKWADSGVDRLLGSGPLVLLHGDFQRNNWLLEKANAPVDVSGTAPIPNTISRVRILDWESAALGPGIIDLFYLALDTAGAGHAPSGGLAIVALNAYLEHSAASIAPSVHRSADRRILRDAIVWGAIASTITRLADYFSEVPMTRTPKNELPGAALDLLEYAAVYSTRSGLD